MNHMVISQELFDIKADYYPEPEPAMCECGFDQVNEKYGVCNRCHEIRKEAI